MSSQREPCDGAPTVGVLGIGNMGEPMAMNLLASGGCSEVRVYGRTQSKLARVIDAGAISCTTPRELAESSSVIISMLPDVPQLRELLAGENGLAAGIREPTVLVIGSTSSPDDVRQLSTELAEATAGKLRVVDAPVSGGADGAAAATLSIMAGGSEADFNAVQPVLNAMGNPVLLGPLGSGEIAKACNQLVVAATIVALSEASVIAERSGLNVAAFLDVLSGGYAGGRLLDSRKQRFVDKDYSVSGAAKFMVKDLSFARAAAEHTDTTTPQLTTLHGVYSDLVDRGFGEQDLVVAHAYIAALSGSASADPAL